MEEFADEYNIDNAWSHFCEEGNINSINTVKNCRTENIPKATEIYISTKTKIAYLNNSVDLNNVFWNIKIIPYHLHDQGVIKKQMKFNLLNEESVKIIEDRILTEQNVDQQIISKIVNPSGRIQFRDIRKVSIGLCQKDILSFRSKKRSAFYNCFVLIMRILVNDKYKEIHVKVFNTGKLEIPGIKDDNILIKTLDLLIKILKEYSDDKDINYDINMSETVLINSNFNCGFYLNRDKLLDILKYHYKIDCVFDACQYPGIQCKYNYDINDPDSKISFMIFRTGSILIVGKCDEDVLFKVYNYIKNILEKEYLNIVVHNIDKNQITSKQLIKKPKKRIIYIS